MKVIAYLIMMVIWNGIFRVGSLKLEGLEGMLIAALAWLITLLSGLIFSIVLMVQGNYTLLLYVAIAIAILDGLGYFYFKFLEKHEVIFGKT